VDLGLSNGAAAVVGGTRGIGLATAMCLAGEGCRVAVIGRRSDEVDRAALALGQAGSPEVLPLPADARSTSEIEGAFESVRDAWGELNILVNAVGPAGAGTIEGLDDAAWAAVHDLGVMTAVRSVRSALPLLRSASWARIVNVTAMSVQHQSPHLVAYTAAKSALLSLTKNLARSLAPEGILVNAVAPGAILTDWVGQALAGTDVDLADPVASFERLQRAHGVSADLGRLGLPDEVAAVVAFCASPRNGYMTGAHINVDGGSDFL
jgi:NAD(P)-dependent dehydrogenase (short-subunit alcohol dehydrogenase family)